MVPKKESPKNNKQANKEEKLKKPFGFCCDENSQDSRTRYDQRKPPFTSSLTDVVLNGGGPDLKFRVQDVISKSFPRSGMHRSYLKLTTAHLGGCRWCRGPINFYLEDEISVAKEMFAKFKRDRYQADCQRDIISARKKSNFKKLFCLIKLLFLRSQIFYNKLKN